MATYYRDGSHDDAQHEAGHSGYSAGWNHANFASAYGDDGQTIRPAAYIVQAGNARVYWEEYARGMDDFASEMEDGALYGHDWHGWSEGMDD